MQTAVHRFPSTAIITKDLGIVNTIMGAATGGVTTILQKEPGNYTAEYILGEIYNQATNRYEYIFTTTIYKIEYDEYGNKCRRIYANYSNYTLSSEESLL